MVNRLAIQDILENQVFAFARRSAKVPCLMVQTNESCSTLRYPILKDNLPANSPNVRFIEFQSWGLEELTIGNRKMFELWNFWSLCTSKNWRHFFCRPGHLRGLVAQNATHRKIKCDLSTQSIFFPLPRNKCTLFTIFKLLCGRKWRSSSAKFLRCLTVSGRPYGTVVVAKASMNQLRGGITVKENRSMVPPSKKVLWFQRRLPEWICERGTFA